MILAQRQVKILEFLHSNEFASYNDLVNALDVSQMTVRRDIEALKKNEKLWL